MIKPTSSDAYLFGSFRLDADRRLLSSGGQPVAITGKAFDILLLLIERREQVVTKDELMERVWPGTVVEEANLTQSISMLRKVLGEKAGENKYIATVTGRGYQFVAPVGFEDQSVVEAPDDASRTKPAARQAWFRWALIGSAIAVTLSGFVVLLASKLRTPEQTVPVTSRLTSLLGEETYPVFSPDGKQVAFAWTGENSGNQDIYVSSVGTGSILRLTTDPANDYSPAWSPDGQYLAFYRSGVAPGCFLIPAIGGPERKIAEVVPAGKSLGRKLTWSPDGKALIFSERSTPAGLPHLVSVSLATGEKLSLTQAVWQAGDEDPVFSPDGSQLAFVRGFVQLFVARADGSNQRCVAVEAGIRGLAWTPDGKSIVYATMSSSGNGLWRVAASGGGRQPITGVGGDVAFPSISPDGRTLVYSESRINTNIWSIQHSTDASLHRSGAADTKVIHSTKSQSSPQISPDGERIVFASDRSGSCEIWICKKDGRDSRQITFHNGPYVGTPRWSPDGQSIVYDLYGNDDQTFRNDDKEIYVVRSEGGAPRNVTRHPAADLTPSYSRDGRWIYFSSNRTGRYEIWRMPAGGGDAVQITRKGGTAPMQSYDGRFVYYSQFTEEPGVFRVPADGGDETLAVPGAGAWGWWTVTEAGIYFIEQNRSANTAKLQFAPFSGTIQTVKVLRTIPPNYENILAADRSGQTLLLQQIDERFGDLIMIQDFL